MKKNNQKKDPNTYIAFLRGINVGGNTLIKMEDLKKSFLSLGYSNIKTILASGNIIFDTPDEDPVLISKAISLCLVKKLGREISVIVRSMEELRGLQTRQPFRNVEMTPKTKTFLTFIPDYKKIKNKTKPTHYDGFSILEIFDGIVVSVLQVKPDKSTLDLMEVIEKEFGKNVTTRNWNTILKVLKAGEKEN
jgi:uncharacterized protein (DUF1697 family)